MKLALAQTSSVPCDVTRNVADHAGRVREAGAAGASVAVFPELSLTGYELACIKRDRGLRVAPDDLRLSGLQTACAQAGVTAVVGAPVPTTGGLLLAALILRPDGTTGVYGKRNLYGPEADIFVPGPGPVLVTCDGTALAVGVCADIGDLDQAREAASLGADAWIVTLLASAEGYAADAKRAARAAAETGLAVAFANHASPTGGWSAVGGSGVWTSELDCVVADPGDRLLIVEIVPRGAADGRRTAGACSA